jgi:nucleolar protein 14
MAKKGSQLKRFKESLSTITRPGQAKRKRKLIPEKDPERGDKLKRIEEQFNAFDTKFTRTKHEVFGRKVKGKVGKPGVSREVGEENVCFLRGTSLIAEKNCFAERTTTTKSDWRSY